MKQFALALEDPRQLVIKDLRVKFSGDTETRGVVQNRVDRIASQHDNLLGNVALGQRQTIANLRRPGIEAAQPNHVSSLLVGKHLPRLTQQTPGGEIAKAATGVQNHLATRLNQANFAFRIRVGRDMRRG
ncbi:hypothetical protein D3C83_11120 [compost metagenome]